MKRRHQNLHGKALSVWEDEGGAPRVTAVRAAALGQPDRRNVRAPTHRPQPVRPKPDATSVNV
jgi:hypothetical protein